jgi:site-specific DNA recombinase
MTVNNAPRARVVHKTHDDKGVVHAGQHQAILAQDVWDAVQAQLTQNAQGHSDRIQAAEPSLLAGLLRDVHGRRLHPSHAKKGSKRYRYYCTACTQTEAMRIPALELEKAVLSELVAFEQRVLAAVPAVPQPSATDTKRLFEAATQNAGVLSTGRSADRIRALNALVAHVTVGQCELEIGVSLAGLQGTTSTDEPRVHAIVVPVQLRLGNHAMRLVVRDQSTESSAPDAGLVALLTRANRWFAALRSGESDSIESLAKEHRQAGRDVTRTIYLAFLAPDIVERLARGEQPIGLGVGRLVAMSPLPMNWAEQRRALGLT